MFKYGVSNKSHASFLFSFFYSCVSGSGRESVQLFLLPEEGDKAPKVKRIIVATWLHFRLGNQQQQEKVFPQLSKYLHTSTYFIFSVTGNLSTHKHTTDVFYLLTQSS